VDVKNSFNPTVAGLEATVVTKTANVATAAAAVETATAGELASKQAALVTARAVLTAAQKALEAAKKENSFEPITVAVVSEAVAREYHLSGGSSDVYSAALMTIHGAKKIIGGNATASWSVDEDGAYYVIPVTYSGLSVAAAKRVVISAGDSQTVEFTFHDLCY
jgi:hypothetical protein